MNIDLFNNSVTAADKEKIVASGFSYLPSYDATGAPILDLAKYLNLPRSVLFGVTVEM